MWLWGYLAALTSLCLAWSHPPRTSGRLEPRRRSLTTHGSPRRRGELSRNLAVTVLQVPTGSRRICCVTSTLFSPPEDIFILPGTSFWPFKRQHFLLLDNLIPKLALVLLVEISRGDNRIELDTDISAPVPHGFGCETTFARRSLLPTIRSSTACFNFPSSLPRVFKRKAYSIRLAALLRLCKYLRSFLILLHKPANIPCFCVNRWLSAAKIEPSSKHLDGSLSTVREMPSSPLPDTMMIESTTRATRSSRAIVPTYNIRILTGTAIHTPTKYLEKHHQNVFRYPLGGDNSTTSSKAAPARPTLFSSPRDTSGNSSACSNPLKSTHVSNCNLLANHNSSDDLSSIDSEGSENLVMAPSLPTFTCFSKHNGPQRHYYAASDLYDAGIWVGFLSPERHRESYRSLPSFSKLRLNAKKFNPPFPPPVSGVAREERHAVCRGCLGDESQLITLREIAYITKTVSEARRTNMSCSLLTRLRNW